MPGHHETADLAALGRKWIAAWNSHDLERVLELYAEDSEMTSDKIPAERCAANPIFEPIGAKRCSCCPICISP
jgi:uncharacterized protein (TIGR02246 family)